MIKSMSKNNLNNLRKNFSLIFSLILLFVQIVLKKRYIIRIIIYKQENTKRKLIDNILDTNYKFEFENDNYDYSDDYIDSICLNSEKTEAPNFIYNKCSRKIAF